ncbi:hypothetical protein BSKO_08866 [Bryopsis sp. KO-2023]|nr:hypothetical protein BSKO_08866 [Bryopsis sp. KO-2023]
MDVIPTVAGGLESPPVPPPAIEPIVNASKGRASDEPPISSKLPPLESKVEFLLDCCLNYSRPDVELPQASNPLPEHHCGLAAEEAPVQSFGPQLSSISKNPAPETSPIAMNDIAASSLSPACTQKSPILPPRDEPAKESAIPKESTEVLPMHSNANIASSGGQCQNDANDEQLPARPGHINTMRGAEVGSMGPISLRGSSLGMETLPLPPKHETASTTLLVEPEPPAETGTPLELSVNFHLQSKAAEQLCIPPEKATTGIREGVQGSLENRDTEMKDVCQEIPSIPSPVAPSAPPKAWNSLYPVKIPASAGAPNLLSSLSRGAKEASKAPPRPAGLIKTSPVVPPVALPLPTSLPLNTPKKPSTRPVTSLLGNLQRFRAEPSLQKSPGLTYGAKPQVDGRSKILLAPRVVPTKTLLPQTPTQVAALPSASTSVSENSTNPIVPPSQHSHEGGSSCSPQPLENQGLPQLLQKSGSLHDIAAEEIHKLGAVGQSNENANGLVVGGGQSEAILEPVRNTHERPGTLAVDFMATVRSLEIMMLEVQDLQGHVMELRVRAAIGGNKLARLDSPMLDEKLRKLKRKAEEALGSGKQENMGCRREQRMKRG